MLKNTFSMLTRMLVLVLLTGGVVLMQPIFPAQATQVVFIYSIDLDEPVNPYEEEEQTIHVYYPADGTTTTGTLRDGILERDDPLGTLAPATVGGTVPDDRFIEERAVVPEGQAAEPVVQEAFGVVPPEATPTYAGGEAVQLRITFSEDLVRLADPTAPPEQRPYIEILTGDDPVPKRAFANRYIGNGSSHWEFVYEKLVEDSEVSLVDGILRNPHTGKGFLYGDEGKSLSLAGERYLFYVREPRPSIVAMNRLLFNEICNAQDDRDDWLEVRNISDAALSLANWEVSIVDADTHDADIVTFPEYILPAGEVLLIVNTAPSQTALAGGINIEAGTEKKGAQHRYLVAEQLRLPATRYLLLLRSDTDKNGQPAAFEDVAGNYFRTAWDFDNDTQVWPLQDTLSASDAPPFTVGEVWQRTDEDTRGYLATAWTAAGYQGGLGYRTHANPATSLGTPGYANTAITGQVPTGTLSISELMLPNKVGRRSAPQWIELYNSSRTAAVNLEGWHLEVESLDVENARRYRHETVSLKPFTVLPNQTVLFVTWRAETSGQFPEGKLYNLYFEHPNAFNQRARRNDVLNAAGFSLKLYDTAGTLIDQVGNLDGERRTKDTPAWEVPSDETVDGRRASMLRQYQAGAPLLGTAAESWVSAASVSLAVGTYYGLPTDIGTPGYRTGGPLPVVLSHFRSARTDAGVVLTWATASEVDTAGFNILRSTARDSAFIRVTPALIPGAGTSGEKHTYTWTDTSAKPNVIYYYRLEEVPLGGEPQAIGTIRLKGHVAARSKLMTRWSALKSK